MTLREGFAMKSMAKRSQFVVTFGYRAKPGKAETLERVLRNCVPISRTEAGNMDYRLYHSTDDDHVFFLFMRYASKHHYDMHLGKPYVQAVMAQYEDLLADPPRIETYHSVLG